MPEALKARLDRMEMPLLGVVPADGEIASFEFSGRPLFELGIEAPIYQAVAAMMRNILA